MPDATPYVLRHPITVNLSGANGPTRKKVIASVAIRRANAKDILALDRFRDSPTRLTVEAIKRLTGLTNAQVQKIDADDLARIGPIVRAAVTPKEV